MLEEWLSMKQVRDFLKDCVYFLSVYINSGKLYDELLRTSQKLVDMLCELQDELDDEFYYSALKVLYYVDELIKEDEKYLSEYKAILKRPIKSLDDLVISMQIPIIEIKFSGVSEIYTYKKVSDLYYDLRLLILNKQKNSSIKDSSFKRAYAYLIAKRMLEQILINDMEVDAEVKQMIDLLNLILKCPEFNTNIKATYKNKAQLCLDEVCEITNRKLLYVLK